MIKIERIPMHATEMLFAVISAVELLVTNETLERLLFTVNCLMSGIKIPPIGGIRTIRTRISFVSAACSVAR